MIDKKDIRRYLWDSMEMTCLRRDAILSTVLVFLLVGLRSCSDRRSRDDAGMIAAIVFAVTLIPFWCFWIIRSIRILRKPEGYVFCRCQLSSPHQQPFSKGAMYFSVRIESPELGAFYADTHAIFQSHGITGPLMEDYVNKTVTIGYNRETGMVVVIG